MKYFLRDCDPYWFTKAGIQKIESNYNAKYMGCWTIKNKFGAWTDDPVEIFYVKDPDKSKGHTHYFGMYRRDTEVYITQGDSAFELPIFGIAMPNGVVLVSRYRHDYNAEGDAFVDGGRDYFRHSPVSENRYIIVTVQDGEFIFTPKAEMEDNPYVASWGAVNV